MLTWPEVVLAAINAAQIIALALIYRNTAANRSELERINGEVSRIIARARGRDRAEDR